MDYIYTAQGTIVYKTHTITNSFRDAFFAKQKAYCDWLLRIRGLK
jgi:hypothetical protein